MSVYPPNEPSQYQQPYQAEETNLLAIISLISGILAWIGLFGLGGLVAVITGHMAKGQIASSAGRMTGDGLATAGLVLGYLNIAITLIGICLVVLIFAGLISGAAVCPFIFQPTY
jgi:hypothetical protein